MELTRTDIADLITSTEITLQQIEISSKNILLQSTDFAQLQKTFISLYKRLQAEQQNINKLAGKKIAGG